MVKSKSRQGGDATLAGRIRIGMVQAGIRTPAELARRMRVNRQTVHRWINSEGDKPTPEMLFKLSDALGVNARWLAMGPPHSPVKPHIPSVEEGELLVLFRNLPQAAKDSWVSSGRDLMKLLTPSSAANPFIPHRN